MKRIFITIVCVLSWVLEAQSSGVRDFSFLKSPDSVALEELFSRTTRLSGVDNDSVNFLADTLVDFAKGQTSEYFLAKAYRLKSALLHAAGDWSRTLSYQDSAIMLLKDHQWHHELGASYLHLTIVYWDEGEMYERGEDFDEAESSYRVSLNYAEKALEEFQLADNQSDVLSAILYSGVSHYYLYEYDKALEYFRKVVKLSISESDSAMAADAWVNMSNVYGELGKLDTARLFLNLAAEYYRETENLDAMLVVKQNLADSYLDQPKRAIEILKEVDSLSQLTGNLNLMARVQEHLYYAHQKQGDFEEALSYYKKFVALKDSMLTNDFKSQELDVRYQTNHYKEQIQRQKEERLRQELALQKSSAQRQRLQIITFSLAVFFVLAIGFFYWRRSVMQKLQEQRLKELEQAKNLETARAMLSGQEQERIRIAEDLHDRLGSTLSAAKMQMEAAASRNGENNKFLLKSTELVDRAIGDTREISHNLISGVLVKLGLSAALADLKESLEVTNQLEINLETGEYSGLSRKTELQLFRITQELVNNSVKHSGGSEIRIKLEENNGTTILSVADNGSGFDPDKVKSGLGLINIQRRVEAISGTIQIRSDGTGSFFIINVPSGS